MREAMTCLGHKPAMLCSQAKGRRTIVLAEGGVGQGGGEAGKQGGQRIASEATLDALIQRGALQL